MRQFNPCLASLAAAAFSLCLAALPAWAASSATSSASDSSATSVGSSSGSVEKSSAGSSKATGVAQGDYKIIEFAAAPQRPGTLRIKLQALADPGVDGEIFLTLPQQAFEQGALALGDTVTARPRPYGTEFASGLTGHAFFLVLTDTWYRELQSNPVVL
ncbi:MAG: hypothetical protein H7337_08345 [Rhizobacter sp.]|nr:hypothetical protein [Rhizobacter sp.]